jgi:hypothetical protein
MVRTSGEYAARWAHDRVRAYLLGTGGPSLKAAAHSIADTGLRGQELERMLASVRDGLQREAPTRGKAIDKRYESLLTELQAQGLVHPA